MLRVTEIQKRFNHIEQSIAQAYLACESGANVSGELKDCIHQLDSQSDAADMIFRSQDETRIRQYVDQLELIGERALDACQRSKNVDSKLKKAVMQAQNELFDLKKQLH